MVLYKEGKQGEIEVQADGHSFEVRFIPIRVRNKRTGSLFIFLDITDRKNYENELIQRAATDGLTNLYNRVQFLEQLDLERKKCELNGKPISLILIDIDNFKKINDQYGHLAGDQVLVHIAGLLKDTLGEDGVAGRMGGEEFAVYLSGMDGETAYQTAERLRVRVQREPLRFSKSNESADDVAYTISIGVAELHDFHIKLETWYNQADICLYASKKNGRNQTTLFRLREHFAGVTPGHG